MNHPILIENQKKRRDVPLWMLVCFAMFSFWQMAFIYYFLEPSSALDGKLKAHYLAFPKTPATYNEWSVEASDLWNQVGKMK